MLQGVYFKYTSVILEWYILRASGGLLNELLPRLCSGSIVSVTAVTKLHAENDILKKNLLILSRVYYNVTNKMTANLLK